MGSNDQLFESGLVLGLGLISSSTGDQKFKSSTTPTKLSLTLSLSGETYDAPKKLDYSDNNNNKGGRNEQLSADHLYRQDSAASSFSNVSVKREREMASEEVEIERFNSSRVSDEDDDYSNSRKKLRLNKAQSALLEESFKLHSTLNPKQKQELARELKLRPRQVEVWFQNRRARTKLKQTEIDYEYLKKCCESLKDENLRLQKEVEDLKALKSAQPLYMQLPAATLTMCPSCERIGGGAPEKSAKSSFKMSQKPQFYNPFTNPSAAC